MSSLKDGHLFRHRGGWSLTGERLDEVGGKTGRKEGLLDYPLYHGPLPLLAVLRRRTLQLLRPCSCGWGKGKSSVGAMSRPVYTYRLPVLLQSDRKSGLWGDKVPTFSLWQIMQVRLTVTRWLTILCPYTKLRVTCGGSVTTNASFRDTTPRGSPILPTEDLPDTGPELL